MVNTSIAAITLNLFFLFGGIFGDPGVKPATYLHYTKNWFTNGKELYTNSDDEESGEEESDEETQATPNLSNRKIKTQKLK